jgi:hypothetical protein
MLKPQREVGGLNVYREASPAFLNNLRAEEREAWITMEMIETLCEGAFEVGFEFEMDLVELGLIVVHPLASLVMNNVRVLLMEDRVV